MCAWLVSGVHTFDVSRCDLDSHTIWKNPPHTYIHDFAHVIAFEHTNIRAPAHREEQHFVYTYSAVNHFNHRLSKLHMHFHDLKSLSLTYLIDNWSFPSLTSRDRTVNSTALMSTDALKVCQVGETLNDSRQLATTPSLKRKEMATPTPSPKCDRKSPSGDSSGPLRSTGQASPSSTRCKRGVAVAASPRQPLKVTKSAGPAMQQQQQSAPMMEAIYDVITLDNMDPGAVLQPEEVATKGKKRHGTHTKTRGSMVDNQARRMTLLSSDMETNLQDRIVKTITLRYGDLERVQRAALCIQRAYRAYTLRKHYRILIRQGPTIMRRRTNTGVGATEGKGAKRLSVMTIQGGPYPHGGVAKTSRAGSNLTRVDTMARLREKSNLYKDRPLTRRERIFKAGNAQHIATASEEGQGDLVDSRAPSPEVGRKKSLKRLGGVFVEERGAGTQLHPLQRSSSAEVFGSAGSVTVSSEESSSDMQEKISVGAPLLLLQRNIGIHQFNR